MLSLLQGTRISLPHAGGGSVLVAVISASPMCQEFDVHWLPVIITDIKIDTLAAGRDREYRSVTSAPAGGEWRSPAWDPDLPEPLSLWCPLQMYPGGTGQRYVCSPWDTGQSARELGGNGDPLGSGYSHHCTDLSPPGILAVRRTAFACGPSWGPACVSSPWPDL